MKKIFVSTLCLTAAGTMVPMMQAEATENETTVQKNERQGSSVVTSRSSISEKTVNVGVGVNLNVRSQGSISASIIGKLKHGSKVKVLSERSNWSQIQYNGETAFVHSDYLSDGVSNSSIPDSGDTVQKIVDVGEGMNLNFRQSPSTSAAILGKIKHGTKINVHSSSNGWSVVTYNGKKGYVATQYLANNLSSRPSYENKPVVDSSIKLKNMVVEASVGLNVRNSPSMKGAIITTLRNGTIVGVQSITNGWAKININNQVGYVSAQYLVDYLNSTPPTGSQQNPSQGNFTKKFVDTNKLNMRSGPSTSAKIITTLSKGTEVNVESVEYGWAKVHAQGTVGYVADRYLNTSVTTDDKEEDVFNLVSYAKKLVGKPYVFGASGPDAFDCSGFVYHVFKSNNYNVSRTSTAGFWNMVKKVDNPVVGDIIFFKDTYITGPSHMGIYIGGGDFIHASDGANGVTISNLDVGTYYKKHFLGYGRL
ncbi:MAG: SH3 domain-containing protein [Bacillaceae bacterium]